MHTLLNANIVLHVFVRFCSKILFSYSQRILNNKQLLVGGTNNYRTISRFAKSKKKSIHMASTAVPPSAPPPTAPAKIGLPSKIYNGLIGAVDKHVPAKLRPLWNHPAGKFYCFIRQILIIFLIFIRSQNCIFLVAYV